ncbi:DUF3618 domain-containing protein [Actinoplanes sp. NPDC023714]|uniref:DUF3618 domain-containing protein n=1 Tax=Actinoplanes sp. NPDC023714 TaxID=3154322 RepID=UPI0033E7CDD7
MSTPVDQQQLRTEIAQTRADLGGTVEALAAKTDVKARARQAIDETKTDVKARARRTIDDTRTRARLTAAATKDRLAYAASVAKDKSKEPRVRRTAVPVAIAAASAVAAAIVVARRR